ncbi:MAG: hypothetical protein JNM70_19115, partial [Anaerolineae bacterium]|nr:hypothetical protein [Anaerolineae bacterium]
MPSPLETLVKILKLEREQGCRNSAVIGGLGAYSEHWSGEAHAQARKPEHHLLVDELSDQLRRYEGLEAKSDRMTAIGYMLDRIMGRVPPPPEWRAREVTPPAAAPPPPARVESPPPEQSPPQAEERRAAPPPREASDERRDQRPRQEPRPPRDGRDRPGRPAQQRQEPPRRPQRPKSDDDDDEGGFEERDGGDGFGFDSYDSPSRSRGGKSGRGRDPVELDIAPMPRLARVPRRPRPNISPEEAADILRGLSAPVTVLKGVGPGLAQHLARLGIET